MFRPLGSFIPDAVLADIGLFFDKDQLHKFSLASPRSNGLFKSYRMMTYKTVEICTHKNNKLSIVLQDSNSEDTKRWIQIDSNKEDLTEKIANILSTCRSIDYFCWEYSIINEQIMELMVKIKIKNMLIFDCFISVSLPLFLKFLHRHGNILRLWIVKLPSELVSNKTLTLISQACVRPMPDSDLVVDVTDGLLKETNFKFRIIDFKTKFTIKGISSFIEKIRYRSTSFGILSSDQMQDANDFERNHPNEMNDICLLSTDGQKKLNFYVINGMNNCVSFSIDLNTTDTDQASMVPIPNNLFGIVAQESFLKFNKIFSNPEELLPISQYQMEYLSIHDAYGRLHIIYIIRGEHRKSYIEKTDVNLKDKHKIIVEILRNCIFIEEFKLDKIKLDQDFYHLLKPIADNIHVPEWRIESTLEPESLREVQAANSGLFAKIKLTFPERLEDKSKSKTKTFSDLYFSFFLIFIVLFFILSLYILNRFIQCSP